MKKQYLLAVFLHFSISLLPNWAFADMFTWTGLGDGSSWSDPDNWDGPPMAFPAAVIDDVTIGAGATVTLDITTGIFSLKLEGGSISSATEMLMVHGGLTWTGGEIAVDIALLGGDSGMVMGGTKKLSKKLDVKGAATLTWDAGSFLLEATGELIVEGEFGVSFDGTIDFTTIFGGKIKNMGIFRKAGGAGTLTVYAAMENGGVLNVDTGKIYFGSGVVTNSGDIGMMLGTEVEFGDGSTQVGGGMYIGPGTITFSGVETHLIGRDYTGGVSFDFEADLITLDANWTLSGDVNLRSGKISGSGVLEVSGTFDWSGGTIDVFTNITAAGTLDLSFGASKILTNTLNNLGTATHSSGDLSINDPGDFKNLGSFTKTTSADLKVSTGEAAGTFSNSGTFEQGPAYVLSDISVLYINTGTTSFKGGAIDFKNTTTFTDGILEIADGVLVDIMGNLTVSVDAEITGTGDITFKSGTSSIATTMVSALDWDVTGGTLGIDAAINPTVFDLQVTGGRVDIDAAIEPGSFLLNQSGGIVDFGADVEATGDTDVTLSGGTLTGSGPLEIDDSFSWTGGTLDLDVICQGFSTTTVSGASGKTLLWKLTTNGSTNWTGGALAFGGSATWTNNGTFTASAGENITGGGSLVNAGTFRKSTGVGISSAASISNTGILEGIGMLTPFAGFGNAGGTISPGLSPGLLTLSGDLVMGARLDIEIEDDSGAGVGHDQLVITNNVTLGGELRVTETGMSPAPDGDYTVLICQGTSPCITGDFDTSDLPAGYTYSVTATEVIVTKSALPVDLSYFEVMPKEDAIHLEWQTATEINNSRFEVERAVDNGAFEIIGILEGQGNSLNRTNYSYEDKALPTQSAKLYYRLKQIDFDETYSYSQTRAVHWLLDSQKWDVDRIIQVADQEIALFFSAKLPKEPCYFRLYTIAGQLLQVQTLTGGDNQLNLVVPSVPAGIYLIQIQTHTQQITKRIRLW